MSIFFELHQNIPREGPGNAEATIRACSLVKLAAQKMQEQETQHQPLQILDIGCGPGGQTLVLAEQFAGSQITALDKHAPFLAELQTRAAQAGVADRLHTQVGDMKTLDESFSPESFDLLWSEGAIYIMGFANGLSRWRPLLKAGGHLVVSELSWLTDTPAQEAREFWRANYPGLQTVAQNVQAIRDCGYEPLDHFVLPEAGWWDDYYTPLEKRIALLRDRYAGDEQALQVLDEAQLEIDLYRRHAKDYGYVFYLMKKPADCHS